MFKLMDKKIIAILGYFFHLTGPVLCHEGGTWLGLKNLLGFSVGHVTTQDDHM